jgi:hypothetical protein
MVNVYLKKNLGENEMKKEDTIGIQKSSISYQELLNEDGVLKSIAS